MYFEIYLTLIKSWDVETHSSWLEFERQGKNKKEKHSHSSCVFIDARGLLVTELHARVSQSFFRHTIVTPWFHDRLAAFAGDDALVVGSFTNIRRVFFILSGPLAEQVHGFRWWHLESTISSSRWFVLNGFLGATREHSSVLYGVWWRHQAVEYMQYGHSVSRIEAVVNQAFCFRYSYYSSTQFYMQLFKTQEQSHGHGARPI